MLSLSPQPGQEGPLAKPRGRGRTPRILGPTSGRHFRLPTLSSIPMTATAHPIAFLPRRTRRPTGGPPVLHGFPPAPTNHSFSSTLPITPTHPPYPTQYFHFPQLFH